MASTALSRIRRRPGAYARRLAAELRQRFARNDILTYASAIGLQLLTAVVPLALLSFLLLGEFGKQSVWREQLGPALADRSSVPVYNAIDSIAEGLMTGNHTGWLVAAVVIAIWEISGAVRACMGGLNRIFERKEGRPLLRRFGLSFALAVALALCTLGSMLLTVRGGAIVDLGPAQPIWSVARWLVVVFLLWLTIALLFRFAPNGHQPPGWLTLGGAFVVVTWVGASLVYAWWVSSVANYKTPFGAMIAILTLVGYLYMSAIVLLVGAQLDELAIEQAGSGKGPFDDVR